MVDETKRKKVVAQKRGVRKKEKTTVTSSAEQLEAEGSVALAKEAKAKSKKKKSDVAKSQTTRKQDTPFATETVPQIAGPSYEQIRLRAYFISVHRCELGVPGDEKGDWIQAEEELRQEMAFEQV